MIHDKKTIIGIAKGLVKPITYPIKAGKMDCPKVPPTISIELVFASLLSKTTRSDILLSVNSNRYIHIVSCLHFEAVVHHDGDH